MKKKANRLDAIKMIISSKEVGSQEELLQELNREGFELTQATLSRDLKQLKVAKAASMIKPGDVIQVKKPPITYSFKVLQTIEKRVGAKLVSEMMENVTTPDQYELLEMSKISGFVDRARGTGRPTKKDRRELEEFTTPEFMDDFDFDFDFDSEE